MKVTRMMVVTRVHLFFVLPLAVVGFLATSTTTSSPPIQTVLAWSPTQESNLANRKRCRDRRSRRRHHQNKNQYLLYSATNTNNQNNNDQNINDANKNGTNLPYPSYQKDLEESMSSLPSLYTVNEDEYEECIIGDSCQLIDYHHQGDTSVEYQLGLVVERTLMWGPVFFPLLAYYLYDPTAAFFAWIMGWLNYYNNSWVAVDGGAYQAKIITPAINGIVVPSISLLFANLIANTVTALAQRQVDIHGAINAEASQIRRLSHLLDAFPKTTTTTTTATCNTNISVQEKCRTYLLQYTSRLIAEGHESANINSFLDLSGMDSELNGIFTELNHYSNTVLATTTAAATTTPTLSSKASSSSSTTTTPPVVVAVASPIIISQSYDAVRQLLQERSKRITAFQSTFPPLHYVIVTTLALSICLAFLMETNQDILVFLNAVQLRILWTMLVATFCALAAVIYDLSQPFRGSYQISRSIDQLYTIRLALRSSLEPEFHSSIVTRTRVTTTTTATTNTPSTSTSSTLAPVTTPAAVANGTVVSLAQGEGTNSNMNTYDNDKKINSNDKGNTENTTKADWQ
jgi:hypothetical protein